MEKRSQKPLTIKKLSNYNQEVLFPSLEERFATRQEFNNFRNKSLTNQDKMLKKMDILLTEKET